MLMEFIFPPIWILGVAFYTDEMTMRFKGKHEKKDDVQIFWASRRSEDNKGRVERGASGEESGIGAPPLPLF